MNTLLVAINIQRNVINHSSSPDPGARRTCVSEAANILLVKFCAKGLGQTSTGIPLQSVSTAELLTYRSIDIRPVICVSFEKVDVRRPLVFG
jgi:hypothetical protein